MIFLYPIAPTKTRMRKRTILAPLEVPSRYEAKSPITTHNNEHTVAITNTPFTLLERSFQIFAGITKNAPIRRIPNIFTLSPMKIERNIRNTTLYICTLSPLDLAISSLITIARKFLPKKKKARYPMIKRASNI